MEKRLDPKVMGERLRKIRDIRPRTKVAKAMNISYSALCKYESGIRVPSGPIKKRIAEYYGTSIEKLFF